MEAATIEALGDQLFEALAAATPVAPLTDREPGTALSMLMPSRSG